MTEIVAEMEQLLLSDVQNLTRLESGAGFGPEPSFTFRGDTRTDHERAAVMRTCAEDRRRLVVKQLVPTRKDIAGTFETGGQSWCHYRPRFAKRLLALAMELPAFARQMAPENPWRN